MRHFLPLLLLSACASPQALVRTAAARDFACPEASVDVETRAAGARELYVARGCGVAVVYGVGGEWFSSWAAPCSAVTVRGQALRANPFASAPRPVCADVAADAGAVMPD